MGVVKTKVEVDVTGESQAAADAARVRRELEGVERAARGAERGERQAGRMRGLITRMRKRGVLTDDGARLGPIALGPGGFRMSNSFLRNTVGGAFAAYIAAQAVSAAAKTGTDLAIALDQGIDFGDWFESKVQATTRSVFGSDLLGAIPEFFAVAFGSRGTASQRSEAYSTAWDQYLAETFGGGKGPLDANREKEEQRRSAQALKEYAEELKLTTIRARHRQARAAADDELAKALKGVRAVGNPTNLPREVWERKKRQMEEIEKLKAALKRRQIDESERKALPDNAGA